MNLIVEWIEFNEGFNEGFNERFGEHRRSILNHNQLINSTPISEHFNQPGRSINDVLLTPLELIHNNRDSVRKARKAYLIDKAMTLEPSWYK